MARTALIGMSAYLGMVTDPVRTHARTLLEAIYVAAIEYPEPGYLLTE